MRRFPLPVHWSASRAAQEAPTKRATSNACRSEKATAEASAIKEFHRLPGVGNAQDQQTFFGIRRRGAVGVFDVDLAAGQLVRQFGQGARFVVSGDHQNIIFHYQRAVFFKDEQGLGRIAQDHAHYDMIDSVAARDGIDIDFGRGEGVANARQHAGPIFQEESQLLRYLHKSQSSMLPSEKSGPPATITWPEKIAIAKGRLSFLILLFISGADP